MKIRTATYLSMLALPVACCAPAQSVAGQAEKPSAAQIEFFEKRIRPLLVTHCYSCHSKDAKKVRGELLLDTRAGVHKGGATGPVVVPGKPSESSLIKAVRHDPASDLRMPPKGKLSAAEIADLVAWVTMGAPDPRDGSSPERKQSGIDITLAKKFWSLQPLRDPAPPAVKQVDWPRAPIDRFILAKLEEKGLTPSGPAEPRTLVRRITFDLTGLPPTPEEIEDFVASWDAPSAKRQAVMAATVDRLLASPAYGERWGRHWLDVVRYADTAGDNSDYPIPQMIKYRDWVIGAFNRDMPYDEFVRAQIAGDLLPPLSP